MSNPSSLKGKGRHTQAIFDDEARFEYLTGFSKRKKAKKDASVERAKRRERIDRLELRKQMRESRKQKVEENIKQQADYYGTDMFATGSSSLSSDHDTQTHNGQTEEYTNNTIHTTVSIEPITIDHDELQQRQQAKRPMTASYSNPKPSRVKDSRLDKHHSKRKQLCETTKTRTELKRKKVPYESRVTRSIDRSKRQRNREVKKLGKKR